MASRFFHVQHEFRAGTSKKWFETVQKALAPGGGWDDAVTRNLEGPAFCIWEVRDGISDVEFQAFIDSPNGPDMGTGALLNICREINVELAGTTPYPRKFA